MNNGTDLYDDWTTLEDLLAQDFSFDSYTDEENIQWESAQEDHREISLYFGIDDQPTHFEYTMPSGTFTYNVMPKEDLLNLNIQKAGKVEHYYMW